MRRKPENGDEEDVFTAWRRFYVWTKRPGATRKVKERAWRRERRRARDWIEEQMEDDDD